MKIGTISIPRTAALAPMAGVADRAFRELCRDYGSAVSVGEMVSAKGLCYGDRKSGELLVLGEAERPGAVQLFGDDPDILAEAARRALAWRPDWIDLNMGCPAPKITGSGAGSALMKDPEKAGRIVRAVADAVPLPVTVKFRKGWDAAHVNAVEFARICEANGAAALTVHGRTREQMYQPGADWNIIRAVKAAVAIPVIGNGDVTDAESAAAMYAATGCDLVMIGRGSYGNPFLFREIEQLLETGELPPPPTLEDKLRVMKHHIRLIVEYKGEYMGMKESRKIAAYYIKGIPGAAKFRNACGALSTLADLDALADAMQKYTR